MSELAEKIINGYAVRTQMYTTLYGDKIENACCTIG